MCGNADTVNCGHSDTDIQNESRPSQGRSQIGVYSLLPLPCFTLACLSLPSNLFHFLLPVTNPSCLLLYLILWLNFSVWFSLSHAGTVRCCRATTDSESTQASLLLSSPPVHSTPHWQKCRETENANLTMTTTNVNTTPQKNSGTNLHPHERVTPDFFLDKGLHYSCLWGTHRSLSLEQIMCCHLMLTRVSQELSKASKYIVRLCRSRTIHLWKHLTKVTSCFSLEKCILGRMVSAEVRAVPL